MRVKLISLGALLWSMAGLACAQAPLPADLGERLTQDYVTGAMQRFAQTSARLSQHLRAWCASSDDAGREQVRRDFADTVESWSAIEFLRFGPLVQANRFERIAFWPDPRGVTLRQVQALLSGPSTLVGDAQALGKRSVAVQGLPALEYVLYRDDGLLSRQDMPVGAHSTSFALACAYASAVGQNVAERGRELAQAWRPHSDYAALFALPGPDNPVYRSQREVASEAFKALSSSLQFLRDIKLAPVVGAKPDINLVRRAPFWRSELSIRSLHASVTGLRAFFQAGGYPDGPGDAVLVVNFQDELARAEQLLAAMQTPISRALADPEGYRQLQLVIMILGNAKRLLDENIAPAFGITIGFNALDGD